MPAGRLRRRCPLCSGVLLKLAWHLKRVHGVHSKIKRKRLLYEAKANTVPTPTPDTSNTGDMSEGPETLNEEDTGEPPNTSYLDCRETGESLHYLEEALRHLTRKTLVNPLTHPTWIAERLVKATTWKKALRHLTRKTLVKAEKALRHSRDTQVRAPVLPTWEAHAIVRIHQALILQSSGST